MADEKQKMMSVNVATNRLPVYNKLNELSNILNARRTDLIWDAIARYVANPPKVAPSGAAPATGSAQGFWVVHILDDNTKVTGIKIVDCKRNEVAGRMFVRYAVGDVKSRERALRQVIAAANYDAQITGITLPKEGLKPQKP